uniref:Putative secreted protein n=1 Tax=Ixodes ricinus TaxID=34613 RepID=A0A6B0UQ52_IXORI
MVMNIKAHKYAVFLLAYLWIVDFILWYRHSATIFIERALVGRPALSAYICRVPPANHPHLAQLVTDPPNGETGFIVSKKQLVNFMFCSNMILNQQSVIVIMTFVGFFQDDCDRVDNHLTCRVISKK